MARLQAFYNDTVRAQLMEQFSYGNVMQVPHIEKITLNMGLGVKRLKIKKSSNMQSQIWLR